MRIIAFGIQIAVILASPNRWGTWDAAAVLAALIVALILTKRMKLFTPETYDRARELADALTFGAEARVVINLTYRANSEQEAELRLQEMGQEGENTLEANEQFRDDTK